ncbi:MULTISPECIES: hypothetical protein [Peribacillus]|nr:MULTISPECIES: hypothetical protein [Peribacillus]MCM3674693.1 hypothetical protein [Peribacillus simplex]MDQ0882017.1 putative membrane protein YfcA [Peribacillus sp. V2I11]
MTISSIILVVAAVFIGALMRTMFGFGEAIVSMPLLALLVSNFLGSLHI